MNKKIKIFLMCFILICMSVFTGCSLVETDNSRLYNNVVSEIYKEGKKVAEITNRELLSGFETYGSMQVQYYGTSMEDAVNMTMVQLQNRKITLLEAKQKYSHLEPIEESYLYEQTVKSLYNNLDSYYEDIVGESNEQDEEDVVKFDGYTKNVERKYSKDNGGKLEIELIKKNEIKGILDGYVDANKDFNNKADRAEIYDNFIDKVLMNDEYRKAFDYYLIDLKSAEYDMGLSKNVKEIFEREIERLYKVNYENYIIEKYSEEQQNKFENLSGNNDERISPITANDLLKLYSSKVRAGYTKYQIENATSYDDDVKNSVNTVYYFKQSDEDTKYFKVANILFQFKDGQDQEYKDIQAKWDDRKNTFYKENDYKNDLDALYNNVKPVIREYNQETGTYDETDVDSSVKVDNIITKIKNEIKAEQATGDVNRIGDKVNELIYTYNEDPGMFNAEANYIIGVDKDGNAVSSFVEEFNNAGLELYKRNTIGDIEIARSSYGIHVLIYLGKCENLFNGIDEYFELGDNANYTTENSNFEKLYNTRVNLLVDKTYIDALYDEIYTDNFANYESANINFLREGFTFKVYKGRYPSTLKEK